MDWIGLGRIHSTTGSPAVNVAAGCVSRPLRRAADYFSKPFSMATSPPCPCKPSTTAVASTAATLTCVLFCFTCRTSASHSTPGMRTPARGSGVVRSPKVGRREIRRCTQSCGRFAECSMYPFHFSGSVFELKKTCLVLLVGSTKKRSPHQLASAPAPSSTEPTLVASTR